MSVDYGSQQFQRPQFGHKPSDVVKPVSHEMVRGQLLLPARGLLLTGVLSVILAVGGVAGSLIYSVVNRENIQRGWIAQLYGPDAVGLSNSPSKLKRVRQEQERQRSRANAIFTMILGGTTIGFLALAAVSMAFVAAGILMPQLRNYRACRLFCLLAIIPGLSPLLILGIPFGIIGFLRLNQPHVRRAFD